jgi:glycosyltransferase involved in cell wall biosynthesis
MPRTILEAMASSLPIVSTNVDGIPELIEHKKDGYLYSPGDVQSLIDCVETLLTYPDIANKVSASARCKYVHNFSQKRHHERLDCILKEIISIDTKPSLR